MSAEQIFALVVLFGASGAFLICCWFGFLRQAWRRRRGGANASARAAWQTLEAMHRINDAYWRAREIMREEAERHGGWLPLVSLISAPSRTSHGMPASMDPSPTRTTLVAVIPTSNSPAGPIASTHTIPMPELIVIVLVLLAVVYYAGRIVQFCKGLHCSGCGRRH